MKLCSIWLVVIGILISSCSEKDSTGKPAQKGDSVEIKPEVIFSKADANALEQTLSSRGLVEPVQEINLQTQTSGFITNWNLKDGQRVQAGEKLITLDKKEKLIALRESEITLQKTQLEFDLEKRQRLSASGGKELSAQEISYLKNLTGLAQAELNVEKAKIQLDYTEVLAPFSGIIDLGVNGTVGQYMSQGTLIGKLVNQEKIKIKIDVLESVISQIKENQSVIIYHFGMDTLKGVITGISPLISTQNRTGKVIAIADNKINQYKSGMSVNIKIITGIEKGKVRLPRAAVLERDQRFVTFKLINKTVEWVYVTPHLMTTEWVILNTEEIIPGDTIAVDKHFTLSHLQKVTPKIW